MNGCYAYAVVGADRADEPPAVAGVCPGGALRYSVHGPVAAVCHDVEVSEFEGSGLERNLADPDWLERMVRSHDEVTRALLTGAPVIPMRFGSIFSTEQALAQMMIEHEVDFLSLLDRVRGRVEWGVKVTATVGAGSRLVTPTGPDGAGGAAYLRRRRSELRAAEEVGAAGRALAHEVHLALARAADDAALVAPRRPDPGLVLSGAYLVPEDSRAFLDNVLTLRRMYEECCEMEVTGPWPAYSFTSVDVSGPAG